MSKVINLPTFTCFNEVDDIRYLPHQNNFYKQHLDITATAFYEFNQRLIYLFDEYKRNEENLTPEERLAYRTLCNQFVLLTEEVIDRNRVYFGWGNDR